MAKAKHGFGTTVQIKLAGVFTSIPKIEGEISFPGIEREMLEITNHESPDMYKEYIRSLLDGGEFTFNIQYLEDNAVHQALLDCVHKEPDEDADIFKVFPGGWTGWECDGNIKSFKPKAPQDGKVMAEVGVKVTGAPRLP